MTRGLSDEQTLLRETVGQIAGRLRAAPLELGEQRADGGSRALLFEVGLPGMRLPERVGGSDATAVDVAIVAEALARTPAVCPFVGPVLANELLLRCGASDDAMRGVASGEAAVTVALSPALDRLADGAEADDAVVGWDAAGAHHAIGLVADDGECAVGSIELDRTPLACADVTRVLLGAGGSGADQLGGGLEGDNRARWEAFALALLAADLLGTMEGALELAAGYAAERRQFKRPIGAFQALQHLLADAWVSALAARSATYYAAWAVDALPPRQALTAARVAKAYAGDAAVTVAETAMQVHGGMGITWESPCHVYLRRAIFDRGTLGTVASQLDAIAETRMGRPDGLR